VTKNTDPGFSGFSPCLYLAGAGDRQIMFGIVDAVPGFSDAIGTKEKQEKDRKTAGGPVSLQCGPPRSWNT
jgi:hypothetical protein